MLINTTVAARAHIRRPPTRAQRVPLYKPCLPRKRVKPFSRENIVRTRPHFSPFGRVRISRTMRRRPTKASPVWYFSIRPSSRFIHVTIDNACLPPLTLLGFQCRRGSRITFLDGPANLTTTNIDNTVKSKLNTKSFLFIYLITLEFVQDFVWITLHFYSHSIDSRAWSCKRFPVMVDLLCVLIGLIVDETSFSCSI